MRTIEYIRQTCICCGKIFEMPSYSVIVPNYCDNCLIRLIKIGEVKPNVSRRKTAEK